MAYVNPNFKTKKALKDAVAMGEKVTLFEPGIGTAPTDGKVEGVEGPHYPAAHTWYASVVMRNGLVVKVS